MFDSARVALAVVLAMAALPALSQQSSTGARLTTPAGVPVNAPADAKMLRAASYSDALRSLGQVRQIPVSTLRANPQVALGELKVDFRPMLDNPRSLSMVAQKLRAMPGLVTVREDALEAVEVRNGLLVRSAMSYRLAPDACKVGNRGKIEAAGVECFSAQTETQFQAALSDSADPRYVGARDRTRALQTRTAQQERLKAGIDTHLQTLRQRAGSPQQRAQLAAAVGGEAELARLLSLDDAALAGEFVNTGETTVEQMLYIPKRVLTLQPSIKPLLVPAPQKDVDNRFALPRHVFLTGFTLGDQYEWKQRISKTINWCVFWCEDEFFVELYANFSFGIGMRFPIAVDGEYRYRLSNGVESAVVVPEFTTFDGSEADYRAAGLTSQHFSGKELVAEISAGAGVGVGFPGIGSFGGSFELKKDFTQDLPGDFKGGNFTPPMPGGSGPQFIKIFDTLDLIGGRGNYGVAGGQLFPAIKTELVSKALSFVVEDVVKGASVRVQGGQEVPLAMDKDRASKFRIRDPEYDLALQVTPGVNARVFIDLAFWGSTWDWQIWFPQLGLTIPEGGVTFGCHSGTECVREYRFVPEGAQSQLEKNLLDFASRYDQRWMPQCPKDDSFCRTSLRFFRNFAIGSARSQQEFTSSMEATANSNAYLVLNEAKMRNDTEHWVVQMQTNWGNQCLDTDCSTAVVSLAEQARSRAKQLTKPGFVAAEAIAQVKIEFSPRFLGAVQASRARAHSDAGGTMRRAVQQGLQGLQGPVAPSTPAILKP